MWKALVRFLGQEDLLEKGTATHSSILGLPLWQETWVRSVSWEDPLEKELVTYSSIIAWEITWTEEPGRLESMGSQRAGLN